MRVEYLHDELEDDALVPGRHPVKVTLSQGQTKLQGLPEENEEKNTARKSLKMEQCIFG